MPELVDDFKQIPNAITEFPSEIPILNKPNYSRVFCQHLKNNRPCIIRGATDEWKSSKQWVKDGAPNFNFLKECYGNSIVPTVEYYSPNCDRKTTIFKDYIELWKDRHYSGSKNLLPYLKDWHLRKQNPEDKFYIVPECFSSDWLNEYSLDKEMDDFMFVYMGPKGSWTPFHMDVYSSFSWSANIIGRKRWLLFPPGEEKTFINSHGNMPDNIEHLISKDQKYYELIQEAGEAIFVPSGWFHQVQNLEDTISINHNWINGCNIRWMWNALKTNLDLVEKEILEFRYSEGWEDHCQLMLRSLFGINLIEFIDFMKHIALKRLKSLKYKFIIEFDGWMFGKNHVLFDLYSIYELLTEITCDERFNQILKSTELDVLICDMNNVING